MDFVSIETPAPRVSLAGKLPEFLDTSIGIVAAGDFLQIVANQLIEAFPESLRTLAGAGGDLLVDGERDIHSHSIRVHKICVKTEYIRDASSPRSLPHEAQ